MIIPEKAANDIIDLKIELENLLKEPTKSTPETLTKLHRN